MRRRATEIGTLRDWVGRLPALLVFSLALAGCAKYPSGGSVSQGTRLIFSFTLAEAPNPNFVYLVAVRPSVELSPTTQGPIPVIAPPWGNGFVAGNATHFVRWDVAQAPDYLLYKFQDVDLLNYLAIGVPVTYHLLQPGEKTIRFEILLNQLVPAVDASQYQSIQVNFFTMDNVPQGSGGSKVWDALGDSQLPGGVNQYVTIPIKLSGIWDNQRFQDLEPPNDVADPSLDIVDWSVEVRPG